MQSYYEHAEFAIRAIKHGIHVLSECTAGGTLRDCVELCEAVEESICKEGTLGPILYAEGEYNHTGTRETLASLTTGRYHWRAFLPRSYFVTHALGTLMYSTGHMPIQVSAFTVTSDVLTEYNDIRHNHDAFAMMNCMTDPGALFRFTGCAHMGSPSGYRIVGEYVCVETGRTLGSQVNLNYHSWAIPEGKAVSQTNTPGWPEYGDLAGRAGHGGSDFWNIYFFVRAILDDTEPFFDVYRSCAMSAVGIYAWRSCLENGKLSPIPDFRDKAQREAIRDDILTPFPDEDGNNATLPCATRVLGLGD